MTDDTYTVERSTTIDAPPERVYAQVEITEATEPTQVGIDLRFLKPFKAQNETVFHIRPDGTGSHVTWTMTGRRTLATKIMGIFKSMDALIGPDFEKGLASLKSTVERPTAS